MSSKNKRSASKLDNEPTKKVKGATKHCAIKYTQLYINNEWVNSVDGKTFDVINPATEEKICSIQRAGDADAEKAITAARKAFDDPSVFY